MGVYSELDIEQKYGDGTGVEAFSLGQAQTEQKKSSKPEQVCFEDDELQQAEADAALKELEKLLTEEKAPEQEAKSAPPSEAEKAAGRKAHEEAEAKRKAEWEAQRAAKKAAEEEQLQKVAAMGEEELLLASAKRINAETERLTRRNMKEYLAEHLQTLCLDDLEFARLTMHPRKSFMHCIWYINRKAREYLEQEMKDNGMQPPYGANGMYGGDVPDDVVYHWAEEYYREMDVEEDKEQEAQFVPKPYTGPIAPKGKRRSKAPKSEQKEQKPAKSAVLPPANKKPEEEEQISLGAFLQDVEKAS